MADEVMARRDLILAANEQDLARARRLLQASLYEYAVEWGIISPREG